MEGDNLSEQHLSWNIGIDDRIRRAISKLGWSSPSPVQAEGIPLAFDGKDVIAKAKTGSGKTAAYLIPAIQKLLLLTNGSSSSSNFCCVVILAPSKELCKQIARNVQELTMYCSKIVQCVDLASGSLDAIKPLLSSKQPGIIVSTPSKLLAHVNSDTIDLRCALKLLVIDEADVMFSYGYEKDLKSILSYLPTIYQAILVSATMSVDVDELKSLVLHNPVVVKLKERDLPEESRLTQYIVKCEPDDKLLLMHALLQLKLLTGKSLVFVHTIDKCYRLKLFLEQFAIKSCVLNSELPQNSRMHIVDEFNKGVYDIVIATDESASISTAASGTQKKSKSKVKQDQGFGVSRGIDFQDVDNVVNFDFPDSPEGYLHRVGRTARGYNSGTALSLICASDYDVLKQIESKFTGPNDGESALKPYNFKMNEIDGFRYRVADAVKAITKAAVKAARLKEIKSEIVNSKKLQTYFEDNPKDLHVLRHDKTLQPKRVQPHLKNVPEYLVPSSLKHVFKQGGRKRKQSKSNVKFYKDNAHKALQRKREDPLKSFSYSSSSKKSKKK